MKRDPVRLLDDPETGAALRADLEAEAQARRALAFDAALGAVRLEAAIAAGAKLSSVGQLAASKAGLSTGGLLTAKLGWILVGGACVTGAVAYGAWTARREPATPAASGGVVAAPPPPPARAVPEAPPPPPAAPPDLAPAPVPAEPPLAARPAESTPRSSPATSARRASEPTDDELSAETAALASLRGVARTDAARGLALAEEQQVRFKSGMFPQEREAIAIDALARLGRREEAKRRAAAFLSRYPGTPLSESVRAVADAP